jgi:ankyrin repeat protein
MVAVLAMLSAFIHAECTVNEEAEEIMPLWLKGPQDGWRISLWHMTPLGVASELGCTSDVKGLVEAGWDINELDWYRRTPLCIAAEYAQLEVIDLLLELGADIEIRCGPRNYTALMNAARGGHVEIVRRLLQGGALVNAQDAKGVTAIYFAARWDHAEVIELLLEADGDPNLATIEDMTPPLEVAVVAGAIEAAKVLAWKGANLERRGAYGWTALHWAAYKNNTGMVRVLAEAGADVDALEVDGKTALHYAALNENVEMLRFLKAAGSLLDTPDESGHTALHYAVMVGSAPVVEEILSWRGIDVNAMTKHRATPLHYAAAWDLVKVAELLIGADANVNACMGEHPGEGTVLHLAATTDKPGVVQLLLKAGVELDPSGDLLIEAARNGCRRAVEVLLEARDWPEELKTAVKEELLLARAEL